MDQRRIVDRRKQNRTIIINFEKTSFSADLDLIIDDITEDIKEILNKKCQDFDVEVGIILE